MKEPFNKKARTAALSILYDRQSDVEIALDGLRTVLALDDMTLYDQAKRHLATIQNLAEDLYEAMQTLGEEDAP